MFGRRMPRPVSQPGREREHMSEQPGRQGMYTREGMAERLSRGNVGEAVFRLWTERQASEHGLFGGTWVEHLGYNPPGVIDVAEKRGLKTWSMPDFALVRRSDVGANGEVAENAERLLGISVNTQKGFYGIWLAMGPYCARLLGEPGAPGPCPWIDDCLADREHRVWHNWYNIHNDYLVFRDAYAADVACLTVFPSRPRNSIEAIRSAVRENEWDAVQLGYIRRGREAIAGAPGGEQYLRTLERDGRGHPREFEIRWVRLSDFHEKRIEFWSAGGRVDRGRANRPVCCIRYEDMRTEAELIDLLAAW